MKFDLEYSASRDGKCYGIYTVEADSWQEAAKIFNRSFKVNGIKLIKIRPNNMVQ